MARIQIADLHTENVIELSAEEQYLIQGGLLWIPFLIKAAKVVAGVAKVAGAGYSIYKAGKTFGSW